MHPSRTTSTSGGSLLVCLGVMFLTAIIVGGALTLTQGISRNAARSQTRTTAIQMGLGAIDMAYASWRDIARRNWTDHPTTADLAAIRTAVMADFNMPQGYSISNVTVTATTPQLSPLSGSTPPVPAFGLADSTISYSYLATADVTSNALGTPVVAKVRRIFEKEIMSPWDYAIFYDGDLEIHPGAAQSITGWVHTNGALYTGHSLLTFGSRVTNVRGWTIGFMPGDGQHPETPQSPFYQADIPPAKDTNHQPFGIDPWAVFAMRHAPVPPDNERNDGWIELIKRPVPGVPDPKPDARYYNQADIRILVDASNNVTLRNKNDRDITTGVYAGPGTPAAGSALSAKDLKIYNVFKASNAAIVPSATTGIQDNRESTTAKVRLVTLDVSKINAAVTAGTLPMSGDTPFNGIVYIADTSAGATGGTPKRGVKIVGASVIPSPGLAIVSENPVYIKGNVNTGSGTVPANASGGDPTQPTASGYTRQPILIAGDAITILSNAWVDSAAGGTPPDATNTTINAAFLGGIVPTGSVGNNYSGGAENFPRFLEDWGGVNLTYYGSMVCLYNSDQSVGIWGKSNVYSPPTRRWYFDVLLRQKPPPGSLNTTNYAKNRWWTD